MRTFMQRLVAWHLITGTLPEGKALPLKVGDIQLKFNIATLSGDRGKNIDVAMQVYKCGQFHGGNHLH